ncbi:MAG: hypothetical protein ACE5G0_19535, partial [Rhodothermales bacterium]
MGLLILVCVAPVHAQSTNVRLPGPASAVFVRAAIVYSLPRLPLSAPLAPPRETPAGLSALKAPSRDPWLGLDKVQHATFGFLWTLGSQYVLVNKIDVSERRALPFSLASSAL